MAAAGGAAIRKEDTCTKERGFSTLLLPRSLHHTIHRRSRCLRSDASERTLSGQSESGHSRRARRWNVDRPTDRSRSSSVIFRITAFIEVDRRAAPPPSPLGLFSVHTGQRWWHSFQRYIRCYSQSVSPLDEAHAPKPGRAEIMKYPIRTARDIFPTFPIKSTNIDTLYMEMG